MPSWEEMCQQIVIDGRPGDVTSAAFGWEQLLKNLTTVKQNLETNVKDLGETWKGPAYEAFKTHIEGIAKSTGEVVADAESRGGIVNSLKDAADKLSAAQAEFPVPASCVNDVLEARNARITISAGFFEMKVKPDFLGLADPISSMVDWFNDKTDDANRVYGQVSGQYLAIDSNLDAPTSSTTPAVSTDFTKPELGGGGGGGGGGGVPDIGGAPSTGGLGDSPSMGGVGSPPGIGSGGPGTGSVGPGIGTGTHPDLSSGTGGYPGGGTGSLGDEYGSGLAGAGGGVGTLPSSGLGGGGLPATTGLGSGGGAGGGPGLGGVGGMIPGGGALGKPVSTGMPGMMGGAAGAGAGRGGAGRGAGRLGGGVGGMGGMAGGMGGAAGRGGAGTGKAAAGGVRGGAGVKGGGLAGMGGGHGAGYGEEEAPRNTWLEEDEDVWGADGDAAPGILR
ncbi:WXG100 family type VII secretion target [Micromonospora sp. URMC 105]|uniref:WXG100 family type VII secretion target n=1 Tax=Micromonospora sp. URMC 105 TaxID=3423413 RepID=UPI003F1CDE61